MRSVKLLALATCVLLAACATIGPLQLDQSITLGPNQGLAAVVMNTKDPLWAVTLQAAGDNGIRLEIQSVPAGRHIYLFQVPAGYYCFRSFMYAGVVLKWQGAQMACFLVPVGQLGYSGELIPTAINGRISINRVFIFDSFTTLLRHEYPKIASQFGPTQPALLTSNSKVSPQISGIQNAGTGKQFCNAKRPTCGWIEAQPEDRSQVIFIKNNTIRDMTITFFQLYDCFNVKESCTKIPINIKLAPHAVKKVFVVTPSDPNAAWYYWYYYWYHENY